MNQEKSTGIGDMNKEIHTKSPDLRQLRSMESAKNLTANNDLKDIVPADDRIVVVLKTWPAQSNQGIFMPESYTVIRGEQYVTQVEAVGKDVELVKKGDVAIVSMYSGHHITTKTGHAKIIAESDILNFKSAEDMEETLSFDPKTFKPGINYILVEMIEKKTKKSEGGIIIEVGEDDAMNKNDVATKTARLLAVGPVNEFGKKYPVGKEGSIIIFDAYVGLAMNAGEVSDDAKYRIMFGSDILGFVEAK